MTVLSLNLSDIVIITVDYYCIIHDVSNLDAIHLLQTSVLDDCGYIQNAYQRNKY